MSQLRGTAKRGARQFAQNLAEGGDIRQAARDSLSSLGQDQLQSEDGRSDDAAQDAPEIQSAGDGADFVSQRSTSIGTVLEARTGSVNDAGAILNQSFSDPKKGYHVISPVVIPHGTGRSLLIPILVLGVLVVGGVIGLLLTGTGLFGVHYWVALVLILAFFWWRRSVVRVPEGSKALVTKFGKVVQIADPGRVSLFNPWKRVGYIVNTTREYPFNAPISEAPTQQGVKASVDLFLQFRIEDPAEFIFTLGSVNGFQSKLQNAVSEVTRSLIYAQRAEDIYDLVGESTGKMLESLNEQFLPAVRLTAVNITHAEPTSQAYRMDLSAPEMVRVAKEAYTYEYELKLRKEQDEGDLAKELAGLSETLSAIQAEIAGYQAQMDTALERESHKAKARAGQRLVEAESSAKANSALLEAQSIDIRTLSAAEAPEILNYRFQTNVLDKLESVADRLPRVVQIGETTDIDFLALARQLIGDQNRELFSPEDLEAIRSRVHEIQSRVDQREDEISDVLAQDDRPDELPAPTVIAGVETPEVSSAALAGGEGPSVEGPGVEGPGVEGVSGSAESVAPAAGVPDLGSSERSAPDAGVPVHPAAGSPAPETPASELPAAELPADLSASEEPAPGQTAPDPARPETNEEQR